MLSPLRYRDDQREEGFTLIELLVVVIIIGILAAIAIPVFLGQRERAWRAAVQSDLRNVAIQAETFFTDNGTYDGFEGDALWTGYDQSDGGNPFYDSANDSGTAYCIQGTHDNLGEDWRFANDEQPQLDEDTCTATGSAHPDN